MKQLPYFTTMTGALAAVGAMEAVQRGPVTVRSLQEYHGIAARR
jgi:carbamoyl-phosphate synthase large subunit